MFRFIYNVLTAFGYSIWMCLMTIITGKLSKISYYHLEKANLSDVHFFNICSDKFIKTNDTIYVSDESKKIIINDFLFYLSQNRNFNNIMSDVEFPIFNGKEIIGSQGYNGVIREILKEYIITTKLN